MHKWLSAVLVMALLAGCAEDSKDTADDAETTLGQAADAVPLFLTMADANITLEDLVVAEGEAINFTLSSGANITAVAWAVESVAEAAASATADGNSTAQGNATAGGNATTEGNATVEPVLLASGTGLPANVSVMPPAGNQTLVIRASAEGYSDHVMQYAIRVVAAVGDVVDDVVEEADPCAGAMAQETITDSGLTGPGVLGEGTGTDHEFELIDCQTEITIAVSTTTADVIIRLIKPDGSSQDYDSNFVGGDTMVYKPGGILPVGTYNAQIRHYATVVDQYDIEISFKV